VSVKKLKIVEQNKVVLELLVFFFICVVYSYRMWK